MLPAVDTACANCFANFVWPAAPPAGCREAADSVVFVVQTNLPIWGSLNYLHIVKIIDGTATKLWPAGPPAACREVADSVALDFWLQPGDLQLVHNHTQVHNRSAYEDFEVGPELGIEWCSAEC